ncbi:MAG: DUF4215 domain-containing protein [Myxococcales bacterium]|nr:DUF4215 domain-containing protein [Myxococcales bacterium]
MTRAWIAQHGALALSLVVLELAAPACFTGAFMEGLPCRGDDDCAGSRCEAGYCGGTPGASQTGGSGATTGATTDATAGTGGACGNGVLEPGEQCDDAAPGSSETSETGGAEEPAASRCVDCQLVTCDEGQAPIPAARCDAVAPDARADCLRQCVSLTCGDGLLDPGEECDDGDEADDDACTTACRPARCGDGLVQVGVELCDDGNTDEGDACTASCGPAGCGDGVLQGVEECDDGNTDPSDACSSACVAAECGDGVLQGDEECDDGNTDNTDGCVDACALAQCGDGHLWIGVEECEDEDGDDKNTDECTASCKLPVCGDGFVWTGVEPCDYVAIEGCTEDCLLEGCGDGELLPPELCDDGNMDNADGCPETCLPASCGDGYEWAGVELCDFGEYNAVVGCTQECGALEPVISLAAGGLHTCAVLYGGGLRCWGRSDTCQLGLGDFKSVGDDELPHTVPRVDVGAPVQSVAAGRFHTCALLQDGRLRCWGNNLFGQLGYGDIAWRGCAADTVPALIGDVEVFAPGEGEQLVELAVGKDHTCARAQSGRVRCWGRNNVGQLGRGDAVQIGDDEPPSAGDDVELGGPAVKLVAGDDFTCALLEGGALRCWGAGGAGQLGYGDKLDIGDDETPAAAGDVLAGGPVVDVYAGQLHTCVKLSASDVRCWGDNWSGELGYGHWVFTPVFSGAGDTGGPLALGGAAVDAMSLGARFTCARTQAGELRCWGAASEGQLGTGDDVNFGDDDGETPATATPINFGGDELTPAQVVAGYSHACALFQPVPVVRCWGDNDHGQLGIGNTNDIGDDPEEQAILYNLELFE